jgi:hypothetical protein
LDNKADTRTSKTSISSRAFDILTLTFIVLVEAAELYTSNRDFVSLGKYLINSIRTRNNNFPLKGISQTN